MYCLNDSFCSYGRRCLDGSCHSFAQTSLTLPFIGAITYDLPSLRWIYIILFILLLILGLINNLFSLLTVIREHIRITNNGIYLIFYSICNLILICLISTNFFMFFYSNTYPFRLWTCHIYSYTSQICLSTSIYLGVIMAIENVLNQCFNIDKFRLPRRALICVFLILIIFSIINLDKIFARYLISNSFNQFSCLFDRHMHRISLKISFFLCLIVPCLIHSICIILFIYIRMNKLNLKQIIFYIKYLLPSIIYIICLFLTACYRYQSHFHLIDSLASKIRLHIGFLCIFYLPQMFTYVLYVLPNHFYVIQFYQIVFFRKLCCCFYNRRRHIQQFEVIDRLWQRRTSLETVKTISSLDDQCVESEFYRGTKTGENLF